MGFVSFVGRVLFASVFLLSAYQEIQDENEQMDCFWLVDSCHWKINPIYNRFIEFGENGGPAAKAFKPKFDNFRRHAISNMGFQLPSVEMKQIIATTISLKGIGGVLFILSSQFGAFLLLLHLAVFTPIVYDFYNYDIENPEFANLFVKFTQNLALFGALLFFIGMKNSMPRRQAKKKATKTKTM